MNAVPAVPPGYHSLQVHLVIRDPAKAIEFYRTVFGPTEIMHAELRIGDSVLMLSGEMPAMGVKSPETLGGSVVNVMHYAPGVDAIYSRAIDHGSQPIFPPADMFWADRFCKFVDPVGHIWGWPLTSRTQLPRNSEPAAMRRPRIAVSDGAPNGRPPSADRPILESTGATHSAATLR